MGRYAFILLSLAVLCAATLSGCQTEQIYEPEHDSMPEQIDAPQYDDLPEPLYPEVLERRTLEVELPGTALTVDFIVPDSYSWKIVHVVQDSTSGNWAVLYADNSDFLTPSWMIWHHARLSVQLFDEQGSFLKLITTGKNPVMDSENRTISDLEPVTFSGNILAFFSGYGHMKSHVFLDVESDEIFSIRVSDSVASNNLFLALNSENSTDSSPVLRLLYQSTPTSDVAITLGFDVPDALHWEIIYVTQDEASGNWAVLYAVSNHGDEATPWMKWRRDRSANVYIYIQLFDSQGSLIRRIDTQTSPVTYPHGGLASSGPVVLRGNLLSFFAEWSPFLRSYVFADTQTGETFSIHADDIAMFEDYFLARVRWGPGYRLELFRGAEQIAEIVVEIPTWYWNEGAFDGHQQLSLSLDNSRTASMSRETITYLLDFDSETYEVLRHYTLEDLDDLVTHNDRWEIFNVHTGRFEGPSWGEVVARSRYTSGIYYLYGMHASSAIFSGSGLLLIRDTQRLILFDLDEMQIVQRLSPREELPRRIVSGIAYDSEKEWFVVLWLSLDDMCIIEGTNSFGPEYNNVMISVYTANGELLRSIDTGVEMPLSPWMFAVLQLEVELDGEGNVLFRQWRPWLENGTDFKSVRYWD